MSPSIETAAPIPATRAARRSRRGKAKAILAIAAGTALLLGGGGTYAYWTTSTALTAGTVQSGDLRLTLGTSAWSLKGVLGSAIPLTDPTTARIVPGDVLTLTQPVTVTLIGNTLQADLAVTQAADFVSGPAAQYVKVAVNIPGLGTQTGTNTYRVTPATAGTLQATVTVTFDANTPNLVGVNTPVDLSKLSFSLTQASS
ncbi:alternate-type signal peptide domain-containing protein [uncultured Microbacterium sp.]|uniref:alternate-type signal peptide domain-containing protein n=1 Tax=uncultured Microbacterium sp. TaxID=191216 RepID=UPI0025D570A5|nr:alternate-type signal peptide domain-containing protein [uncultured Microbacterium sp.]